MLVYVTDLLTNNKIAVNPSFITAVFPAPEGEHAGNTVIGLVNGSILIQEQQLDVVGQINGELKSNQ
jgi:hypothetical protein